MDRASEHLYLGIDAGTTKVAAVVSDSAGRSISSVSVEHHADLPAPPGHSLQSPRLILDGIREALASIPSAVRAQIGGVGVTGQMHGVLLVNQAGQPVSDLVTWQDQRCAEEPGFLELLKERTGSRLFTGYGCATLAWMAAHDALPVTAWRACSLPDHVALTLCESAQPVSDPTNAASFGLFDLRRLEWDKRAAAAAGIATDLLPRVVPTGSCAGSTGARAALELGIPVGCPVAAAIGDNQASLVALLARPEEEAVLTLGTGAQLSVTVPFGDVGRWLADGTAWECRPYAGGRMLVTAASLSGGSAWRWLARAAASWARDLGADPGDEGRVYARLNVLGAVAVNEVTVNPHFLGERHDPALRGSIRGIDLDVFTLGGVARGLARGIVTTLKDMMPPGILNGRERVIGSGNALRRNALLRSMAEEVLGLPLVISAAVEEAALGASMVAAGTSTGRPGR